MTDDSFLLCFNAHHEATDFSLPAAEFAPAWLVVLDTADPTGVTVKRYSVRPGATVRVVARAMMVLQAASQ